MKQYFDRVRAEHPLIHCITNYVTVNDCANILLACGASPIMADDAAETAEITSICAGTVLNIGTLNSRTVESMLSAGSRAKELGHPVVLDPVGAGASRLRTETAMRILSEVQPDVVRCNMSELKMMMNAGSVSRGVDAAEIDRITDENLASGAELLRNFSRKNHCVTAVSGAIDLIAAPDGRVCAVHNGHPMMSAITGSGCMLSVVTGAFAAASGGKYFESVCAAFCAMGIAGERAHALLLPQEGNATYRSRLIDAFYCADTTDWERSVRCEMH